MPISQARYEQLFNLLQHSNVPSFIHTFTANQVSTSHNHVDQPSCIVCNTTSHTNISSHTWILDFGANDRVCSSLYLFNYYYEIKPIKIALPNGNCNMVQYVGNISFSSILYLNLVLFAPEFNLNLISISKLCQVLKCFVIFSLDHCVWQEMNTFGKK